MNDLPIEETPEDGLPGAWSRSDFMGGDPDERGYAQRWVEDYDIEHAKVDWKSPEPLTPEALQERINEMDRLGLLPPARLILGAGQSPDEPIGYDGFGAPLYTHQVDDDPRGAE